MVCSCFVIVYEVLLELPTPEALLHYTKLLNG
jgi:hypothetical protein